LANYSRLGDRLAALGDEGVASGFDDGFDVCAFVERMRGTSDDWSNVQD
jgi:hypothetical protein